MREKHNNKQAREHHPFLPVVAYLVLCILLTISIFFEATQAPTLGNGYFVYFDKVVHFGVFGLLTYLVYKLVYFFGIKIGWPHLLTITVIVTGIGLVDEMIQSLSPGRLPSAFDLLADFAGVLAVTLFVIRKRTIPQPKHSVCERLGDEKQKTTLTKMESS